jgi:hypothetical protein
LNNKGVFSAAFNSWLSGKTPATADNAAWIELFKTERLSVSNLRNNTSGNVYNRVWLMLQGGILHNPDMVIRSPTSRALLFWQAVLSGYNDKIAQTPLEDRIKTSTMETIICKNLLRIPTIYPLNNIEVVVFL